MEQFVLCYDESVWFLAGVRAEGRIDMSAFSQSQPEYLENFAFSVSSSGLGQCEV